MSLRLSRGEAEGELEKRELCRAPNPRTCYSLSNLYHPGMRGFERVATRGNENCGLSPNAGKIIRSQPLQVSVTCQLKGS